MKKNKICWILLTCIFIILMLPLVSHAAQGNFSISKSSVTLTAGNTTTFTITATNCEGQFTISSSNSSVVEVSSSSVWVTGSQTITLTAKKAGTATVTIEATDVGDTSENEVTGSEEIAVTVNASSSSGNSSSGGGNSGSGSSGQSTPTFTEVNETVYATSSVNIRSSYSTSSNVVGSLDARDSVTRTGRGSNGWSRVSYNGQTAYISSNYLTTEKPEESNNKNLESLTIEDGLTLTPEFNSDVTEYSLTVGADVTSIDITATAEDDNAEVEITGNNNLLMGENTVEIKVTAEDGTERTYTINVTKGEVGETVVNGIGLSELSIEGYTLSPEFSSNIYEYALDVPDITVTNLMINAKSNLESAIIEIVGNNELKLGENIITILVKSENEDGETETVTYQIIANIHEPEKSQIIAEIDDEDLFLYGGIVLAILIILVIIIVVVVKRRKSKEDDDYGTYYGGFSSLNNDMDSKMEQNSIEEEDRDNSLSESTENKMNNVNTENEVQLDETNKQKPELNEKEQTRKSVIEENFGADIKPDYYEESNSKRKRGKHF